jgi:hypothetical protein
MLEREFVVMIYRAIKFYADDPQTGQGQRRGLLLAASALKQRYRLDVPAVVTVPRAKERKAPRTTLTEQEAKQDKETLDMVRAF